MNSIAELIPVLQTAIGPVILISGVGLLLLSMTNRLSRVIDRARNLLALSEAIHGPEREKTLAQIDILWEQARLIRKSILFAAVSVLCAALLIIALFITALFGLEDAWLISIIFVCCMVSLILSLVTFIRDINNSLSAFKVELYGYGDHSEKYIREGK
ncbi:MAG: DUF2721 domain-containing protein [Chloroflexi bacterium]|nr:DUF2721 domain-containing protein [Chloroflexota bacterium]